jgi:hypothetical protein
LFILLFFFLSGCFLREIRGWCFNRRWLFTDDFNFSVLNVKNQLGDIEFLILGPPPEASSQLDF